MLLLLIILMLFFALIIFIRWQDYLGIVLSVLAIVILLSMIGVSTSSNISKINIYCQSKDAVVLSYDYCIPKSVLIQIPENVKTKE